jgi:hypothetical protein
VKLALLVAIGLAACQPGPVTPTPDAEGGPVVNTSACETACANMATIGCMEGKDSACLMTMTTIDAKGLVVEDGGRVFHCADLANVTTSAGVRSLGLACTGVP